MNWGGVMPAVDIPHLGDVRFVKQCELCAGTGKREQAIRVKKKWEWIKEPCEFCAGNGKTLTAVGERLLAFLKAGGLTVSEDGWKTLEAD